MPSTRLWAATLFALLGATAAHAQECDAVLKYGAFDVYKDAGSSAYDHSFRNFLCNEEASSSSKSYDASFNWGPIGAEGSSDEASSDYKKFCSDQSGSTSYSTTWQTFRKEASKVIADAWLSCIQTGGESARSLAISLVRLEDPRLFQIVGSYTPIQDGMAEAIPYTIDVAQEEGIQCKIGGSYVDAEGQTITIDNSERINCRRANYATTYDITLQPGAGFTTPTQQLKIARAYVPQRVQKSATLEFDLIACTKSHCDSSWQGGRLWKKDTEWQGRVFHMNVDGNTSGPVPAPTALSDIDIATDKGPDMICRQIDNLGATFRVDSAVWNGKSHLIFTGNTNNAPHDHARVRCVMTYVYNTFQ